MASGEENSERYVHLIQQLINLQMENNELWERRDNAPVQSLTKKPDRPVIDEDFTDEDWALFVNAWGRYKEICDLTNLAETRNELRTACLPNINRLLFQLLGSETLNIATKEQLLHQIQLIAVKGMHKEVHRHTFHNIRQQEEEGITHFLAKLQS